jgi:hypothetical protein
MSQIYIHIRLRKQETGSEEQPVIQWHEADASSREATDGVHTGQKSGQEDQEERIL